MLATIEAASPTPGLRRCGSSSVCGIEAARQGQRRPGVGELEAARGDVAGDRAVEQAGVEAGQAPKLGDALCQRALAGGGGTVDGDDHGTSAEASKLAPSPSSSARNPGKLVATIAASSTVTGARPRAPGSETPWRCGGRGGLRPCRRRARACRPATISVSPSDARCDAVGDETGNGRRQSVALLHLELGQPLHARLTLGKGGDDGEHRILVDHAGRAARRHRARPSAWRRARECRRRARRPPRAR